MKSCQNEKWSKLKVFKIKIVEKWSKQIVVKMKSGENEWWPK